RAPRAKARKRNREKAPYRHTHSQDAGHYPRTMMSLPRMARLYGTHVLPGIMKCRAKSGNDDGGDYCRGGGGGAGAGFGAGLGFAPALGFAGRLAPSAPQRT